MSHPVLSASTPFRSGLRNAFGVPMLALFMMMIGVGGLARDGGFSAGVVAASTVLIWAGPGQLVFFATLAAGGSLSAAALAISVSSIRLMPMAVALLPHLRQGGQGLWRQMLLAHFMAVTAWVEGMNRLPGMEPAARVPYFLGFAAATMAGGIAGSIVGHSLVGAVSSPLAATLLFSAPLYFTISLVGNARETMDRLAVAAGFALTPALVPLVPGGFDLVAIGLVGGGFAYGVRRVRRPK